MPVQFEVVEGEHRVRQSFDFPTVYLDHWAMRQFSTTPADGDRFLKALRKSRGSLVISHATLAEFAGPSDAGQGSALAAFMQAAIPNIYFAVFDIGEAMRLEDQQRDLSLRLMLPPDIALLKEGARLRSGDHQPFPIERIVQTIIEHRDRVNSSWRASNQRIADRINAIREDPEFVRTARAFSRHDTEAPTLSVFQELLRPVHMDGSMTIDLNDGGDLMHSVLSISYCDFVLLDGKWEDFHERIKRRFADLGVTVPTAKVFSARRDGVDRFLQPLESALPGEPTART